MDNVQIMSHRGILTLLFMLTLLTSCGPLPFDKTQANLMPQSVAMGILEKHGYGEWAKNPYLDNIGSFCGTEREYVDFNGIGSPAHYFPKQYILQVHGDSWPCMPIMKFNSVTSEDQARELVNALVAMGAKIKTIQWAY
jgi:hypothetical protein